MDKKHCRGCYDDVYNNGCGGAKECWLLKSAKLIMRKEVHISQRPPWKQPAKKLPSCYHKPQFVFVAADREN